MGIALGILTTPGREALLASLLSQPQIADWDGPRFLVVDGETATAPTGWLVSTEPKHHRDNGAPFRRLLALAQGDDLIALEEDVTVGPRALDFIRRHGCPPDLAFVSFFECCFVQSARLGLYTAPCVIFSYAQALLIPARTIDLLLAGPWDLNGGSDSNIATALWGQRYGIHVPAVVQHVGRQSIAHPERRDFPYSRTYLGDGYNYLDLLPPPRVLPVS